MTFQDITKNELTQRGAAISVPKYSIRFLVITAITEKAICIEKDDSSWIHKSINKVWLPISQIEIVKTYLMPKYQDAEGSIRFFEITLPEWLVKKNNLY